MGDRRTSDGSRTALRARHLLAIAALERALDVLERAGVEVLPVKGIVTSNDLYDDPAERPFLDIDLRVRPRDLSRALAAGVRAGFPVLERSRLYRSLAFDVFGVRTEIEAHVGPPGFCGLSVDAMLARATMGTLPTGRRFRHVETHDHGVLLCVNALKDKLRWAQPGAVTDLERLPKLPSFDPERMARRAEESSAATCVRIVAAWLSRERGTTDWFPVVKRLPSSARSRAVARVYAAAAPRFGESSFFLRALTRATPDHVWRAALSVAMLAARGASTDAAFAG